MKTVDVVIVGGGPTGMLSALGLAQRGVDVLLLEADDGIMKSPRAMVYHWAVFDGLERLGVREDIEARGFRSPLFMQRNHSSGDQILLSHEALESVTPYPYNVHLGQHEVVEIVYEHLRRLPNAEVRFATRVVDVEQDGDGAVVRAETDGGEFAVRGRWVIGTDGARSTVRTSLDVGFDGITWPERFVATNIYFPFNEHGLADATMLLDPDHGCIIARIDSRGLWRWTWSESAELPEESVAERIPGRFAGLGFGDDGYEVDTFTPYRMHQRAASAMRTGRVLLAGDAAHATNPTGGLGLTSGLFDVYALISSLAAVIAGEADPAQLDRWSQERLAKFNEIASPMASAFKTLVYDERDPAARLGAIEMGREAERDPALHRERLMIFKSLETGLPAPVGADSGDNGQNAAQEIR